MTQKSAFSSEEWDLLRLVPALISAGMVAADASGLFATIKEASAGMSSMAKSFHTSDAELMHAFAEDRSTPHIPDPRELMGQGDRALQRMNLKSSALSRLHEALALLQRSATPEESQAYQQMIYKVAEDVANASKEGGFLGFGGVRVSPGEQSFLDELRSILKLAEFPA
jgi:hypothetical protein